MDNVQPRFAFTVPGGPTPLMYAVPPPLVKSLACGGVGDMVVLSSVSCRIDGTTTDVVTDTPQLVFGATTLQVCAPTGAAPARSAEPRASGTIFAFMCES